MVSYEIIGSRGKAVAIIDVKGKSLEEAKKQAREILARHKSVKTVLGKVSPREGVTRIRNYIILYGEKDTTVIHKEYGYRLILDPTKVYFSAREGEERRRIASKVKPGEKVLVMFAGVGPYCIAIAKNQPEVGLVVGVEINPDAYKFFTENIKLNKVQSKVLALLGDVRDVCVKFFDQFDRIVMPLPLGGKDFLGLAVKCINSRGYIHYYSWGGEEHPFNKAMDEIENESSKGKFRYRIVGRRLVSQYAPRIWKVRLDIYVERE